MSNFAEDHAAGKHQKEIVEILEKLDPCFHGHSRAIGLIALLRMMAVMLAPASKEAREESIREIPKSIRAILAKMDSMMDALK
jgi:hypothetical protein